MRRTLLCLSMLVGCAAPIGAQTSENPARETTDSLTQSALTDIQTTAEVEEEATAIPRVATRVVDGALRVSLGVPGMKECTFGTRDIVVQHDDIELDLDENDTHAWLFGGASIACEGEQPLYAWSLLDATVSAPNVDVALDEEADAMLSDVPRSNKDTYVVRVRGHAFEPVRDAKLEIGGVTYDGKVHELRDELTHWEVTFDVPPEKWVGSVLAGEDAARLVAHVDSKEGLRDVDARVTIGFAARISEAARQPLEDD